MSPKEFKALQAEWDKKLKESGFEDAEYRAAGTLKRYHSVQFFNDRASSLDPISLASKQNYYTAAEHFLNSHQFASPLEKQIWQLHSEGVSAREISSRLGPKAVGKKTKVNDIIKKLAKEMTQSWKQPQEE